jgi:hypothetical protein
VDWSVDKRVINSKKKKNKRNSREVNILGVLSKLCTAFPSSHSQASTTVWCGSRHLGRWLACCGRKIASGLQLQCGGSGSGNGECGSMSSLSIPNRGLNGTFSSSRGSHDNLLAPSSALPCRKLNPSKPKYDPSFHLPKPKNGWLVQAAPRSMVCN